MDDQALPSIADVLASQDFLSPPDASNKVVKIGPFAVKYGRRIGPLEADNLKFLERTAVPTPKVFKVLTDPENGMCFIIMELVAGDNLEKLLPSLTTVERTHVFGKIREALAQLRALEPPNYIGAIGNRPLGDGVFSTHPCDPIKSGPFANEDEMHEGICHRLAERCAPAHVSLLRKVMKSTLVGHSTVFTHADLQPRNIMVSRNGTKEDGSPDLEIKIIDWETSGWYPAYWEFCNATVWGSTKPEWLDAVQDMMTIYPQEYLMVKEIRRLVFLLG